MKGEMPAPTRPPPKPTTRPAQSTPAPCTPSQRMAPTQAPSRTPSQAPSPAPTCRSVAATCLYETNQAGEPYMSRPVARPTRLPEPHATDEEPAEDEQDCEEEEEQEAEAPDNSGKYGKILDPVTGLVPLLHACWVPEALCAVLPLLLIVKALRFCPKQPWNRGSGGGAGMAKREKHLGVRMRSASTMTPTIDLC